MAVLLNIETSTTNCSVSLSKNGETLLLQEDNATSYSHAEQLHVFIQQLFKTANISPTAIDAIAVSKGPGSYTGLRIGVSTAKGLCYALDKPLIAVSTLESLAHTVNAKKGLIIPMLDARRLEVYTAIFTSEYQQLSPIEAKVLDSQSFKDVLDEQLVYVVGPGAEKTKQLIRHPNLNVIDNVVPSALQMAVIATNKYKKSDTEDVAYFEPFYLKDFVALKPKPKF